MSPESEDGISMVSGNIPVEARVSPDRHPVSNALGSATAVPSVTSPPRPSLNYTGIQGFTLVLAGVFLPATFPLFTFLFLAAFRRLPFHTVNSLPWFPFSER